MSHWRISRATLSAMRRGRCPRPQKPARSGAGVYFEHFDALQHYDARFVSPPRVPNMDVCSGVLSIVATTAPAEVD